MYGVEKLADEVVQRVRVTARLAGKTLCDLDLRARHEVYVLGIKRQGAHDDRLHIPSSREQLIEGDELVVSGSPQRIQEVRQLAGLES